MISALGETFVNPHSFHEHSYFIENNGHHIKMYEEKQKSENAFPPQADILAYAPASLDIF